MSYTPPDQLLTDPLTDLIDSISEVAKVIEARLVTSNREWTKEHRQEIFDMQIRLYELRYDLLTLRESTK